MDQAELQARIDKVSESIVLAESQDSKSLNVVHGLLNDIAKTSAAAGLHILAENAKKAGRLIERVIIDSPPNSDKLLQQIGTIVSSLQSDLRDALAQTPPADSPAQEAAPLTMENFEDMAKEDTLPGESIVGGILEPPLPDFGESEAAAVASETGEPEPAAGEEMSAEPQSAAASTGLSISLPSHVDMDIFIEFLSRQPAVMDELEAFTLALDNSRDAETFNKVKRIIHTLKGEAGLLGLDDVQKLCHATETLLEEDSEGEGLVDILFAVKDWLSRTFAAYSKQGVNPGPVDVLMELLFETKWTKSRGEADDEEEAEPEPEEESVEAAAEPEEESEAAPEPEEASAEDEQEEPAQTEGGKEGFESIGPASFLNVSDIDLLTDFINEASEHLENVENCMLTIETDPGDEASLNMIFRAFHTIKGVAGYLALDQIGHLSHDVESLLDMARKGEVVLQGRMVDILFESVDMMKQLVANVKDAMTNSTPLTYEPGVNGLLDNLRQIIRPKAKGSKSAKPSQTKPVPKKQEKEIPPAKEQVMKTTEPSNAASSPAPAPRAEAPKPAASAAPAPRAPEAGGGAAEQTGGGGFVEVHESIKVDADRLDRLVDTIGELVITESMVSQMMRDKYTDSNMMG
ncbi:MAG: Hpt domain-containing protein, partial [Spirochaetota bacterium]|nr:Hpt domain-containing protein [Spirochaetota bacterium]